MLKYIFCFSLCLYALAMPSFADLTQQDLNEIRKVIKEEIEQEITPIKTEIASVKREIAQVRGKLDRFGENITMVCCYVRSSRDYPATHYRMA